MKNKGIIINGEWLGERVLTDGLFHAICNISPTIMQEFVKIINKIDQTDDIVKISKFEFPDRNSIDIEFNGHEISGLASLYFRLNEGSPELVNRKVVLYNLDENKSREVLNETLSVAKGKNAGEELIRVDENFVQQKRGRSRATASQNNLGTASSVQNIGETIGNGVQNGGMPMAGNVGVTGSNAVVQNPVNNGISAAQTQYNETVMTDGFNNQNFTNAVNPYDGTGNAGSENFASPENGVASDDASGVNEQYQQGQQGQQSQQGQAESQNQYSPNPQNVQQQGIPNANVTSGKGGGSGSLATQIADELCKKIPSLSVPPIQVNLQTPAGSTPMPVQQGAPHQPMQGPPRNGGFGGNPHSQQRPTINDFSNQGREGFGGQRAGFGRNGAQDFARKERPKFPPREPVPVEVKEKDKEISKEENKEEKVTTAAEEKNINEQTVKPSETGENNVPEDDVRQENDSSTDSALMEMHDELMSLREELSAIRALKDPKLMTIEEFLEMQKESKPETFGTKFKIMGSSGSSVNANLLDDGFFVAGDKIYRWGDTLYLDK